jgi:crotonobetainyl-CoA:carnitine CoA-transferase CaiB-like acyl-CoA transferase
MERPELVDDPRFRTGPLRAANWEALDAIVLPWAAERTAQQLFHEGQQRRIPFSLIPSATEVLSSPQLAAHGFFETVTYPAAGILRMPGAPFRIDADSGISGRAPLLGEHTAVMLAEAGVARMDLPRLRAAGTI